MNQSFIKTIGNTPHIELSRYAPNKRVKMYAKLEGTNPSGSIKDRIALYMVQDAIRKGLLQGDKTVVEATSGNTGIGLAMILASLGIKFVAVMPDSVSIERRKLLGSYGAGILLTDGSRGTNGSIQKVHELLKQCPRRYVHLDQYSNVQNPLAHFETTGQEIVEEIPDLTHFVAGMGTGGTLMGVGKRIKMNNPGALVVGLETKPNSIIQGLRNMKAYTPPIYDVHFIDEKLTVDDEEAVDLVRDLIKSEGISVGFSSGANLWGAIQTAKTIKSGIIVSVFPDRGDRYLSTNLFKN
jgi:S-sulfo-L-cysteine synthase (O-acetyl-L-serine-dependent)